MNRKRGLSIEMIRRLHEQPGISSAVLILRPHEVAPKRLKGCEQSIDCHSLGDAGDGA